MLLLLEVATLQGGIEIADVKPDLHAKATEAFAECARNRGAPAHARSRPGGDAGTRIPIPYQLAAR